MLRGKLFAIKSDARIAVQSTTKMGHGILSRFSISAQSRDCVSAGCSRMEPQRIESEGLLLFSPHCLISMVSETGVPL